MSMMDVLSQIRERIKRKRSEELPWFCLLLSDKCVEPEKTCVECRIYQKYKEGNEDGNQNAGNKE